MGRHGDDGFGARTVAGFRLAVDWPRAPARGRRGGRADRGPPWIILDPRQGQLLTLDPGAAPGSARIAARAVNDAAGKARRVHDAVPWRAGELLLATDAGLAVYTTASGRLGAAPFIAPPRVVTRLFLDRKDRLWLGGQGGGLWMIEGRRGAPRSFDALPMIAGSTVEMIADDADPDGVVVSLGERGVARLRSAP